MKELEFKKPITKEELLANGWEETNDAVFPIKKCLSDKEHEDYDAEEGDIELVIHGMHNIWAFGLSLPDGGLVDIVVDSIEQLNMFEKMIAGYNPPY
jgi:hypothetical protein